MIMQETNAFGTSDLIMQSAEQNPISCIYQKNLSLNLCSVAVGLYGNMFHCTISLSVCEN